MAHVTLRGLRKAFATAEILHGIDLDIAEGEFVVLVGPSGCGKSTLLRCIAGLEDISSGSLCIGGTEVNELPPAKRGIAMVFQSYALYPHMTVEENMGFGLRLGGWSRAQIQAAVRRAAQILQIDHLLQRKPKDLSGGQRQRVAIGRAIVRKPAVFLFDEPLSNLDAALRVQMRVELARLHRELQATMVYVTHDQVEAMTLADRIVVLNAGRVEQVGTPMALYHQPCNRFVAGFLGSPTMNFLPVTALGSGAQGVDLRLPEGGTLALPVAPHGVQAGQELSLGVRPEHLRITPQTHAPGCVQAQVQAIEALGDVCYLYASVAGEHALVVRAEAHCSVRRGQRIGLQLPPAQTHLFDPQGRTMPRLS
ncbi:MAG: ABC transporter ATP-binding protein [Rhodoferax sp.]